MKALIAAVAALSLSPPAAAAPFTLLQVEPEALPTVKLHRGELVSPTLGVWRVPTSVVPGLRRAGLVRSAEPDVVVARAAHTNPSDELFPQQWWYTHVGADRAEPPGPGRPLTVIDSGLDLSHPEFAGRPNTLALNTQTTRPVRRVDDDGEYHGTSVGSVAAAPANGVGLVGVYPQATLHSYDAAPFGDLMLGDVVEGIDVASRTADGVINLSIGISPSSDVLEAIIGVAYRRGSLVVAASGNEREEGSPEGFPASYAHVLTVGATNEADAVADFSSASPSLDLAAPGEDIPVAVPLAYSRTGYAVSSGTSASAPIVAGAAAWVWTARPELDNTQLFEVMRRSARDLGPPGWDADTGLGLLDIPTALTTPPPVRDPMEPNDDFDFIRTGGELTQPALTTRTRGANRVMARVDAREDPDDLYRLYVPAGRTVTATLRPIEGEADLELWSNQALTLAIRESRVFEDRLARSAKTGIDTVRWANRTGGAQIVYADARPRAGASATYLMSIRTTKTPSR